MRRCQSCGLSRHFTEMDAVILRGTWATLCDDCTALFIATMERGDAVRRAPVVVEEERPIAPRGDRLSPWIVGVLIVFAWLASGCAEAPVVAPRVVERCALTEPPPEMPRLDWQHCDGFEACLSLADAHALADWRDSMRLWSRMAWERCGVR